MTILDVVSIKLDCRACGQDYRVPLKDVLLSHIMLHEGCCAPYETECPAPFQSRYFSQETVEAFAQAWRVLEIQARTAGGELVLSPFEQNHSVQAKQ